jgi:hypothetical protein
MDSASSANTVASTINALLQLQLLGQLFSHQQHQILARQQQLEVATLFRSQIQEVIQVAPSPLTAFLQQRTMHTAPSENPRNQRRSLVKSSRLRSPRHHLNEREELLIFVKILFRCLKEGNEEYRLVQAKAILAECTLRNRVGDADYKHLKCAVESRLRQFVGELYWARAKNYLNAYCQKRGIRQPQGIARV